MAKFRTEKTDKEKFIEDEVVSLIEEARKICCEHDLDWNEMCERSRI